MYIYRTEIFNEQVKHKGLGDHVDRLCGELATMTLEQVFARFERVYPYLKRKEGNKRLIARIRRVGEDNILCWLKVYRRGDRAYEEFLRDRTHWTNKGLDSHISDDTLWQWLNQQKAAKSQHQQTLLPLSDELRPWLNRPSLRMDFNGVVVYESEAWLNAFATPEIQGQWMTFNRIIAKLADAEKELGQETTYPGIKLYGEENLYVLYSRIKTADTPQREVLFLIAPFIQSPDPETIKQLLFDFWRESEINIFNPENATTLDELTIVASRAYPSYLLADETNWLAIENAENANLALSAEEEAILHGVSTTKHSLPLFLNGQAGSGKSTMLFHLFADYCHRHLRYCYDQQKPILAKPHPLFLAYNEKLLKVAKERVIPLLASHYRFLSVFFSHRTAMIESVKSSEKNTQVLPDISPFFQSFRTFLRNLLPLEERNFFNDANYISFHKFCQLVTHKNLTKYSPELSWQVIRTFIKGYHLDERDNYLDLEDYKEIPRREQTVTEEEFEEIYETVWKWYHRYLKDKERWDDQDLIRKVLTLKCYRPAYTAIFCDEAQDFTHLELQLIMKLSVFSQYDLEHQHVESLPFAFAGDPLQTLNPTGFRWASLKAAFYNEVITTLSPTGRLGLEMNFAELESNYRSIPSIVGVNNLIQLWRSILFDIPELRPQKARKNGDFLPQKLIIGRNTSLEELKDYIQDTIILIPCDQGGEKDYVRKDELLKTLHPNLDQNEKPPWNVLSAIAAKGLEFKQVVLYKFGEECDIDAWNAQETATERVKYFFNKLYVAASRATERLFIVDTVPGEKRLWKHASNADELDKFLDQLSKPKYRQQWEKRVQLIRSGDRADALSNNDLPAIAETFANQGIESENADLLRRAQGAYLRLGNEPQADFCEAWALKFEENYVQAGEHFIQLGELGQTWNCFWLGMDWSKLLQWYNQETNPQKAIESESFDIHPQKIYPLVKFMATSQIEFKDLWDFSLFIQEIIATDALEEYRFKAQWKDAIQTYKNRIIKLLNKSKNQQISDQWQPLGEILQKLSEAKYPGMAELAAKCFYRAGNYPQAVEMWEEAQQTQTADYNLAKAYCMGFPEGLSYLEKSQNSPAILEAWKKENSPTSTDWLKLVAPALEQQKNWVEAVTIYQQLNNVEKVKQCLNKAKQDGEGNQALKQLLTEELEPNWEELLLLLETYPTTLTNEEVEELGLPFTLIHKIAYSELKPEALSRDLRKRYERFLKDEVILHPDWEKHLSMQELGVTLEKIGALVETLAFYERYTHDNDTRLQTFARDRWLATKQKQQQYLSKQGQVKKAIKSRSELRKKSQQWQLPLENVSLTIPVPPAPSRATETPSEAFLQPTPLTDSPITGLPENVVVESPQPHCYQFTLRHLQVKLLLDAQQLLISDRLCDRTLRLDIHLKHCSFNGFTCQLPPNEPFSFQDQQSSYQGIFDPVRSFVLLTLTGIDTEIKIQWV